MKLKKKTAALATGVLLVGSAVLGGASAASAATAYPEGGTWKYGIIEPSSTYYVYSDYHHPSKKHRSTACNKNNCSRSTDKGAGAWSYASIVASGALFGTNNTAYYYVY